MTQSHLILDEDENPALVTARWWAYKRLAAIVTALVLTGAAVGPAQRSRRRSAGERNSHKPKPAHSLRLKPTKSRGNWRPWKR